MKAINLFLFLAVLALGGCDMISKNAEQGETVAVDSLTQVVGDATEMAATYTQSFDQAILAFEQGDRQAAATNLQAGINLLVEEGKTLEGVAKQKIDTAIAELEAAKLQLEQGQLQAAADLKEIIFNAQVNTPRRLLADAPVVETSVEE